MLIIEEIHARENPGFARQSQPSKSTCSWRMARWAGHAVPSVASTGVHEAHVLRDGDKQRFGGKGVLKAVTERKYCHRRRADRWEATDQEGIDALMIGLDGT